MGLLYNCNGLENAWNANPTDAEQEDDYKIVVSHDHGQCVPLYGESRMRRDNGEDWLNYPWNPGGILKGSILLLNDAGNPRDRDDSYKRIRVNK